MGNFNEGKMELWVASMFVVNGKNEKIAILHHKRASINSSVVIRSSWQNRPFVFREHIWRNVNYFPLCISGSCCAEIKRFKN